MNSGVESARITPEGQEEQSTLFALSDFSRVPVSPRELCARINLNWMAAMRLFENHLLSFDPSAAIEVNRTQEAELRFLGGLIAGGCDESLLRHLLDGLAKPYAYRLDRMYYDWESRRWKLAPSPPERETQFEAWVDQLVDAGQMSVLENLRATLDRSITDLRRLRNW